MKVLLLNGSPHTNGNTALALAELEKTFAACGVEAELIQVGSKPLRGCLACDYCYEHDRCVMDDLVNETAPKFLAADGLVVASPVYYASANATLIAFLDRLFYSTEFIDKRMKVGASVAVCRRGGASATFDELNKYFTIAGMPVAEPVLEQRTRPRARRRGAGRGGAADHAHARAEHELSDEIHRARQRGLRPPGEGKTRLHALYPLNSLQKSNDSVPFQGDGIVTQKNAVNPVFTAFFILFFHKTIPSFYAL